MENSTKKKFLFVGHEALSGDLAWSIKKEGHEIRMFFKSKSDSDVYDGFLEKVEKWEDHKDWADVVVFDNVGFGSVADRLRKEGKLVVGGSAYTDKLETDRDFGQQELKKYGVNILPSFTFTDYDEAIDFIKKNPDRYVFKPGGNVPSAFKSLSFVGQEEDGRDMLEAFMQNKHILQKKSQIFQLQKYVSGVEVAVGAFFNGKDFIYPININFEHKRVFPGDIGPMTGEMGTLMFWSKPNTLFRNTLEKMKPALIESGYVGYVDINCIVNGRGIYPLEFTSRFGYPTIQIQQEGIIMPAGEWLHNLAAGIEFELKTKRGFQIGVGLFVPSHLNPSKEMIDVYRDLPIFFKKPDELDGVHIDDVKIENNVWRIAGESGSMLIITGSGTTVTEAQSQAYNRVKNILVQNMFYRTDIGAKWATDGDKLQTWGYLY
jgi:phosphoribosylamine--glycine ligase